MPDLLDYIFQFPSQGVAVVDPIVGPFFNNPGSGLNPNVLVYQTDINSVTPLSGYWCMISQYAPENASLSGHPNIQIVNDRTLQIVGQSSVLLSTTLNGNTEIIVTGWGQNYGRLLLTAGSFPLNSYITEDALNAYIVEDASAVYVTEQ